LGRPAATRVQAAPVSRSNAIRAPSNGFAVALVSVAVRRAAAPGLAFSYVTGSTKPPWSVQLLGTWPAYGLPSRHTSLGWMLKCRRAQPLMVAMTAPAATRAPAL
jgi:hypothetical protein